MIQNINQLTVHIIFWVGIKRFVLHTGRKWCWWVACSHYRVVSMSRLSDSEKEIEFDMTLETLGVDMDRVWTGA